ncbi:MAG TPA: elongation factor Ts [Candidatus Fimihabitans intestinipullorum]|uniref:Elongation factor Ts n=1 Tax=Candidatus Fimihabitans intestinipullorum TaxID=2840820 RepID=A0A9D1HUI9_9BACT|nr:elongation factor Ts [Candidatus Fimihabitans intestinipullorum]
MMISASLVKELREKTGAGMLDCKKALEANNGDMDASIDWLREKGISKAAKKADRIAAEGLAAIKIDGNTAAIVEVNSETDFVAKNPEFQELVDAILDVVVKNDVKTVEEALACDGLNDLVVAKTSKIGEKLSFRRFEKVTKTDDQAFGSYIHMGGKIAVLTVLNGASEEVARDVAMHAAAMRPTYVKKEDVPADELERERTVLKEQAMNEGKPAEIAEKMVAGRIQKYYKEICLEEQPFVKDGDVTVGKFVSNNGGTIDQMIRYEVGEGMEKREENFAEEVMKQMQQ